MNLFMSDPIKQSKKKKKKNRSSITNFFYQENVQVLSLLCNRSWENDYCYMK